MSLEQIGDLTDWQILNVYGRAQEGKPEPAPATADSGLSPWELYRFTWVQLRGMSEEDCRAKWQKDYPDHPLPGEEEIWKPTAEQWALLGD